MTDQQNARVFPTLRDRLLAVLALGAAVDRDDGGKDFVEVERGMLSCDAGFLWLVLDYAISVDPPLRNDLTSKRIDELVRRISLDIMNTDGSTV